MKKFRTFNPIFPPDRDGRYPCPVCGEDFPETIYVDRLGQAVGCNECLCEMLPEQYFERQGG